MVSKMENEKFNVLTQVISEHSIEFDYPDKAVFSNLYYASLVRSLQGMAGTPDTEKADWEQKNEWLKEESSKVCDIPVIDFDNLVTLQKNQKTSCDVFFYNFELIDNESHFLGEFKRVNKRTFLDLLNLPNEHEDSIFRKVSDSIENIRHNLLFGGSQEADDIVKNTHFFAVYAGKNTIPTSAGPRVPTGNKAVKDADEEYYAKVQEAELPPEEVASRGVLQMMLDFEHHEDKYYYVDLYGNDEFVSYYKHEY